MELYTWQSLPDARSVRLLHLRGQDSRGLVQCSLEIVSIDETPTYTAISHCWGERQLTHSLSCEGRCLPITTDLNSLFTKVLIRADLIKTLWVDAICIDQGNPTEKASQVLLMKHIFSRASLTIVYLGAPEKPEHIPSLFDLGNRITEMRKVVPLGTRITPDEFEARGLPPIEDIAWLALARFFCNAWFDRAWVVQEYVLADNLLFLYGEHWKPSDYYVPINEALIPSKIGYYLEEPMRLLLKRQQENFFSNEKADRWMGISTKLGMMESLRQLRKKKADYQSWTLRNLLNRTFTTKATDPRDYIFGALGIMPETAATHADLQPSYQAPATVAYTKFARYLLETKGLAPVLYSTGFPRLNISRPTWVPDWSTQKLGSTTRRKVLNNEFTSADSRKSVAKWRLGKGLVPEHLFVDGVVSEEVITIDSIHLRIQAEPQKTMNEVRLAFLWNTISLVQNSAATDKAAIDLALRYLNTICFAEPMDQGFLSLSDLDQAAQVISPLFEQPERQIQLLVNNEDLQKRISECMARIFVSDIHMGLCLTQRGEIGRVPHEAIVGDRICFFMGVDLPFVIREKEKGSNEYLLIDHCLIQGKMDGELWEQKDLQIQEICLV
jgi:hypothetical protein